MNINNLKKTVCTVVLFGVITPVCYGNTPIKLLRPFVLRETETTLFKNLADYSIKYNIEAAVMDGMMLSISGPLSRELTLTKAKVWPDEAQARFILQTYLDNEAVEWNKASPTATDYVKVSLQPSPEKYILSRLYREDAIYKTEIEDARNFYSRLYSKSYAGTVMTDEVKQEAENFAKNAVSSDFQRALQEDIQRGDIEAFLADVNDYYNLYNIDSASEADAALRLYKRHPQGRTLALQRAMNSPFSPINTVTNIKYLMQKTELLPSGWEMLRNELESLFAANAQLFEAVSTSAAIENQKKMLENFATRLEAFLAEYGRMPHWNSPAVAERNLASDWTRIYNSRLWDDVGALHWAYEGIDEVLKKFGITDVKSSYYFG